ncbi:MAG: hypothetical protein COW42_04840 [Deltaproteobacteria bacterium CG17_big_fil_post_rev_8_21_14_2_50_63_7]|nr:MAG: hypothetical protein COW42_04840 [Deltaproteobacteria bacterium CG17_big_fil_post_rev_8_21_14_2_50_63_7]
MDDHLPGRGLSLLDRNPDPRGVLLMTCGAIQTDVYGLAPTYFRRGSVGGNENRGYVALPE